MKINTSSNFELCIWTRPFKLECLKEHHLNEWAEKKAVVGNFVLKLNFPYVSSTSSVEKPIKMLTVLNSNFIFTWGLHMCCVHNILNGKWIRAFYLALRDCLERQLHFCKTFNIVSLARYSVYLFKYGINATERGVCLY